jgi:hypothetical protein
MVLLFDLQFPNLFSIKKQPLPASYPGPFSIDYEQPAFRVCHTDTDRQGGSQLLQVRSAFCAINWESGKSLSLCSSGHPASLQQVWLSVPRGSPGLWREAGAHTGSLSPGEENPSTLSIGQWSPSKLINPDMCMNSPQHWPFHNAWEAQVA